MEQDAAPAGMLTQACTRAGSGAPPAWPLRAGREELADAGRECLAQSAARGRLSSQGRRWRSLRWSVGRRYVPHRDVTRRKTRTEGWCVARRSTSPRVSCEGTSRASGAPRREPKAHCHQGQQNERPDPAMRRGPASPRARCPPSPGGGGSPSSEAAEAGWGERNLHKESSPHPDRARVAVLRLAVDPPPPGEGEGGASGA